MFVEKISLLLFLNVIFLRFSISFIIDLYSSISGKDNLFASFNFFLKFLALISFLFLFLFLKYFEYTSSYIFFWARTNPVWKFISFFGS